MYNLSKNHPENKQAESKSAELSPDRHSGLTEDQIMLRTFVAMCIPAAAAVIAMGQPALFNILTSVITAVGCHLLIKLFEQQDLSNLGEPTYKTFYSPLVAGMIVGLCVGELSPYPVTALISAVTMVVFKWGQEKYFGRKIINPAAGAKALVLLLITSMWFLSDPLTAGQLFYPEHLQYNLLSGEGFVAAMEFAEAYGFYGTENLSITESLFLWKRHGWIGGASGLLTVASGVLLAIWIRLKWRLALSYLAGMTALSVLLGAATGSPIIMRIAFHVFTGSVIFLAFYMATEPQTTPATTAGEYAFGAVLAVLTMAGQLVGLYGSSFVALAIMNPFAPYFDRLKLTASYGAQLREHRPGEGNQPEMDTSTSPVLSYDSSKCIMCKLCVKACDEIQEKGILSLNGDDEGDIVRNAGLLDVDFTVCDVCGECFEICPTGALSARQPGSPIRKWEADSEVQTTCSNCAAGCQIKAYAHNDELIRVEAVGASPNQGALCVNGRFGHAYVNSDRRLTRPLLRKNGDLVPVSWQEALSAIKRNLEGIKEEHGSETIGALASGKATNEGNYLLQKFMRICLNTNNIDHTSSYCQGTTLKLLEESLGTGAMTGSIEDLKESDCILVAGSNLTTTHPVISRYVRKAVREKGADLIVLDPREILLARWSSQWLSPNPGSDVRVLQGILKTIIDRDLYDEEFVEEFGVGFEGFRNSLPEMEKYELAEMAGIPVEKLDKAAELIGRADRFSILIGSGITQHSSGSENVKSLINLALLTGNITGEGAGIYPLQGQINAQGAADMGAEPHKLPGYQSLDDGNALGKFTRSWQHELPDEKGMTALEMRDSAAAGELKALIALGANPLLSQPHRGKTKKALDNIDLFVVIDPFLTESGKKADVVLPAATFLEKDGTFTSSERRISRVNKLIDPPGSARADWEIICALARNLGHDFGYNRPEEIMNEITSLTPIYQGINYESIEGEGIQWPLKEEGSGTSHLHKQGPERGKAAFLPMDAEEQQTITDEEYPLQLTTGRSIFRVHTDIMNNEMLKPQASGPYAEINPQDALEHEINDGEEIQIRSPRGAVRVSARVTDRVQQGAVFLPIHFVFSPANRLTDDRIDENTMVPELKRTPCRLEKLPRRQSLQIDEEDCRACDRCRQVCPTDAIEGEPGGEAYQLDYDSCIRCINCLDECPFSAIDVLPSRTAKQNHRQGG